MAAAAAAPAAAAAGASSASAVTFQEAKAGCGFVANGPYNVVSDTKAGEMKTISTSQSFARGMMELLVMVKNCADAGSVVHTGLSIADRAGHDGPVGSGSGVSFASNGKVYLFGSELALEAKDADTLKALPAGAQYKVYICANLNAANRTVDIRVNDGASVRIVHNLPNGAYRWSVSANHPAVQFHLQPLVKQAVVYRNDPGLTAKECAAIIAGAPANPFLVLGEMGAGKSAFISSTATALQKHDTTEVVYMAAYAATGNHKTLNLDTYRMRTEEDGYTCGIDTKLGMRDTPGSDNPKDPLPANFAFAVVNGHARDGLDRKDIPSFGPKHPKWKPTPDIADRAAGAFVLIACNKVETADGWWERPKATIESLSAVQPELPIVVVMTHADDEANGLIDPTRMQENMSVQQKLAAIKAKLGVPAFAVVALSEVDTRRASAKDYSVLQPIAHMVRMSKGYIPKMKKRLAEEAEEARRAAADAQAAADTKKRLFDAKTAEQTDIVLATLGADRFDAKTVSAILARYDNDSAKAFAAKAFESAKLPEQKTGHTSTTGAVKAPANTKAKKAVSGVKSAAAAAAAGAAPVVGNGTQGFVNAVASEEGSPASG